MQNWRDIFKEAQKDITHLLQDFVTDYTFMGPAVTCCFDLKTYLCRCKTTFITHIFNNVNEIWFLFHKSLYKIVLLALDLVKKNNWHESTSFVERSTKSYTDYAMLIRKEVVRSPWTFTLWNNHYHVTQVVWCPSLSTWCSYSSVTIGIDITPNVYISYEWHVSIFF